MSALTLGECGGLLLPLSGTPDGMDQQSIDRTRYRTGAVNSGSTVRLTPRLIET